MMAKKILPLGWKILFIHLLNSSSFNITVSDLKGLDCAVYCGEIRVSFPILMYSLSSFYTLDELEMKSFQIWIELVHFIVIW